MLIEINDEKKIKKVWRRDKEIPGRRRSKWVCIRDALSALEIKWSNILTCATLGFIHRPSCCLSFAKAAKSSGKRNDPCLHLNRGPHVVMSILCYWNRGQRLPCGRQESLTFNKSQLFHDAKSSVCLSSWKHGDIYFRYHQGLGCRFKFGWPKVYFLVKPISFGYF